MTPVTVAGNAPASNMPTCGPNR
ncbi:MAG: hypothetical protein QOH52_3198, partial [Pseudonocardiales bacterium]|nr:hypothetical protein [Pseudonocardiales bacterium]